MLDTALTSVRAGRGRHGRRQADRGRPAAVGPVPLDSLAVRARPVGVLAKQAEAARHEQLDGALPLGAALRWLNCHICSTVAGREGVRRNRGRGATECPF